MAVVHSPMHLGSSAAHLPSALHMKGIMLPPQSTSMQGLHDSPHSLPAHGSAPPQPGHPVVQRPFTHSDFGHDVVPSGHIWHGAAIAGQPASDMHWAPHVGYVEIHWPATHSTVGH